MDKEALERILKNEKEKHQDEWREIKNAVFENLEKLREFAKKDNISEEDVRLIDGEFMGKLRSLTGEHILWIWGSVKTNEKIIAEFLNRESFRSIRLEAEKIRDVNEIERIREPLERVTKERNTKLSTVSSWLCVMNPFVFIPAYRGIFSKPLLKELGLKRFFGDDTDIDKYITLLKALSEINKKLQIESMIEAAFYLSKFKNPTASSQVNTYMENLRATQEPKSPKIDEITRQKIEYLLKHKKQVILYGPPGTGKTWIARNYVNSIQGNKYKLFKGAIEPEISYFIRSVNPDDWWENFDEELYVGYIDTYEWGKTKKFRFKEAFEEIKKGDLVFYYIGKKHKKIYAVARCISKKGLDDIKVEIIDLVDGPSWEDMKKDEILSKSTFIRTNAQGTLFKLEKAEGERVLEMIYNVDEKRSKKIKTTEFVTFHPSYSYEEFVEGIRPVTDEEGRIKYRIEDGIFKRFCRDAYNALLDYAGVEKRWEVEKGLPELDEEEKVLVREALNGDFPEFYLIIDEINRGDISKIFGELITLLEADKRLFAENEITVTLPYSKERFGVPPNLYIIGTMNTADRSIALIDIALRRRFGFIELMPDYSILERGLLGGNVSEEVKEIRKLAINALKALNERIKREYDRDHQIGHSYLLKLKDAVDRDSTLTTLKFIWYHEILPLLQEYFYDSPDRLAKVLNDRFVQERDSYIEFKEEGDDFLAELEGVAESKD